MEPSHAIDGVLDQVAGEHELLAARLLRITSWMMILGTVRMVSALGDYGSALLDISPSWFPSLSLVTRFVYENSLALVLASAWPLILAILLRKTTSREFLLAGAITFFILSLGGFLNLLSPFYFRTGDTMVSIGSFTVSRAALWHGNLSTVIRTLLGAVQLTLELATAVSAWIVFQQLGKELFLKSAATGESRRRMYGRLAIYVSLAFLVVNVRQPVWSTYLAVLDQSNLFRSYVLNSDTRARTSHRTGEVTASEFRGSQQFPLWFSNAFQLAAMNKVAEAKKVYQQIILMTEATPRYSLNGEDGTSQKALALNNLAWLLTTCEDVQLREPEQALSYAKKAVELSADERTYWNTLGAAYYRVRDWDNAINALDRSMKLSRDGEGDGHDWIFLAMIHARKYQREEARQWYDRAVTWFHKYRGSDRELYRFLVEAAETLGIPKPPPPVMSARPLPPGFANPFSIQARTRRS